MNGLKCPALEKERRRRARLVAVILADHAFPARRVVRAAILESSIRCTLLKVGRSGSRRAAARTLTPLLERWYSHAGPAACRRILSTTSPDAALENRPAVRPGEPEGVIARITATRRARRRRSFRGRHFNPFMNAGGLEHDHRRLQRELDFRPRQARLRRRLHRRRCVQYGPAIGYRRSERHALWGTAWKAATPMYDTAMQINMSGSVMSNRYKLLRSRPDLSQRVRPADDANDLRLQGERAQDRRHARR